MAALGPVVRLTEDDCLLAPGSADDIRLLMEMGYSTAFPNLPSRNPHSVTLHLAEGMALLTALGSAVRLAEDDCLLAPGSADDIRLSMEMGYSLAFPNLPSKNPHSVTLHLAEGVALLTALGSAVRVAKDDCRLAPGSADDIRLSMKMGYSLAFPNLPSRNPHSVTLHLAEGVALLTAQGSAVRLAEDGCLLAPGSADDTRLSMEMGYSLAFPNLPSRNPHSVTLHLAEGVAPLTALGSAVRVAKDDCRLAPGSADDIRLSMKMGYSLAFPNLPSRNPHSVTLHLAEGVALLTALGPAARLKEGGCLLAPGSVDDIHLAIKMGYSLAFPILPSTEGAALWMTMGPKAALAKDGYLLAPGSVEVDRNSQYHV